MLEPRTFLHGALAIAAGAVTVQFAVRIPSKTHLGEDILLFALLLGVVLGASYLPSGTGWISWVRTGLYTLLAAGIPLVYYHTRTKVDVVAASYYLGLLVLVLGSWEAIALIVRLLR